MISSLLAHFFNEDQKLSVSSKGLVLWVCLNFTDVCTTVKNFSLKYMLCAIYLFYEVSFKGYLSELEISGAESGHHLYSFYSLLLT